MKIFIFFTILFLFSCSSQKIASVDNQAVPGKILGESINLLLPRTPIWRNFSSAAKCFIKQPAQYLDFEMMNKTYNIEADKIQEIQAFYNYSQYRYSKNEDERLKNDQEVLFETIEKVMGNVKYYDFPRFKAYNLIGIDGLSNSQLKKKLVKFLDSPAMNQAVPILISFCSQSFHITDNLKSIDLDGDFPYAIGIESLVMTDDKLQSVPMFFYNLKSIFNEGDKINLFTSGESPLNVNDFIKGMEVNSLNY